MKVVIIGFFPDAAKDRILESFPSAWNVRIVMPDEAEQELTDADVLIPEHIRIDDDLLQKAPKLKLVQTGAGYDNVDLNACEHVMAFILCWYKNIVKLDRFLKMDSDERELNYCGAELAEKTIGLVGFGHVGKKVAEYCNAFHMNVLVCSRKPTGAAGIEQRDLDSLVRDSDIVSACFSE